MSNTNEIGNYTEPNQKKIIKIGTQLAKKSANIDTKKKKKIQSNWAPFPFLKSVEKWETIAGLLLRMDAWVLIQNFLTGRSLGNMP